MVFSSIAPMLVHLVFLFIVLTSGHNPCNHTGVESVKCVLSTKTVSPQIDWTHTYEIQSRDGVSLNTIVHFVDFERSKHATILERTPYDCSKLSPSMYTSRGFHYATQDFRGRFGSGGEFSFWAHGAEDASDTFSFLQKQDWTNGHFFAVGMSADGIACYLEPKETPPLFGQYVVVGTPNVHRSCFQQGGFRKSLVEGWLADIDESAFLPQILEQESYNAFWADQDVTKEWYR
jgi:putative CocE/NonD family hydrolase